LARNIHFLLKEVGQQDSRRLAGEVKERRNVFIRQIKRRIIMVIKDLFRGKA
jgi:hypothetical protein